MLQIRENAPLTLYKCVLSIISREEKNTVADLQLWSVSWSQLVLQFAFLLCTRRVSQTTRSWRSCCFNGEEASRYLQMKLNAFQVYSFLLQIFCPFLSRDHVLVVFIPVTPSTSILRRALTSQSRKSIMKLTTGGSVLSLYWFLPGKTPQHIKLAWFRVMRLLCHQWLALCSSHNTILLWRNFLVKIKCWCYKVYAVLLQLHPLIIYTLQQ